MNIPFNLLYEYTHFIKLIMKSILNPETFSTSRGKAYWVLSYSIELPLKQWFLLCPVLCRSNVFYPCSSRASLLFSFFRFFAFCPDVLSSPILTTCRDQTITLALPLSFIVLVLFSAPLEKCFYFVFFCFIFFSTQEKFYFWE